LFWDRSPFNDDLSWITVVKQTWIMLLIMIGRDAIGSMSLIPSPVICNATGFGDILPEFYVIQGAAQ